MSVGTYLAGLAFFIATFGSCGVVARLVVTRRLPALHGAPALVAGGLVALAALIAVHLAPGMLGILSRWTVLAAALLALLVASRLRARRGRRDPPGARTPRRGLALAGLGCAAVAAYALAATGQLADTAPTHVDAQSFALPGVADWIRTGSIWHVGEFVPLFMIRTYPNNGDVLFLASILPWNSDAFLRLVPLPLLALTGAALYGLGRELRAPPPVAALVAATVVASRIVAYTAVDQLKPDVFMYATFAGGLLFLTRHARTRATSDLVLGGLGLGLAFGSRWYGVSAAVVVLAVWGAGHLLARAPLRSVLRQGAVLGGCVLAGGGFWLIRNLALTGNPLYPVKLELGGVTLLDAPRDIITEELGYTLVDRLGQPGVLGDYIVPDYRAALGLPGLVLALGVLLGLGQALVLVMRRRTLGEPPARVLALVAIAAGLVLAYAITPGSGQGLAAAPLPGLIGGNARWLVPAMLPAAGVAAWAVGRSGRLGLLWQTLLVAAVLAGLADSFDVSFPHLALAAAAVLAACALVWLARARRLEVTAAAAAALVLAVGGYALQRDYNDARFRRAAPSLDWVLDHAPSGRRIGVAGDWGAGFVPTYGLFGPRLGNDVRYVGRLEHGLLSQFSDREGFVRALERGGYDVLVVGRQHDPDFDSFRRVRPYARPPEARWAESTGRYALVAADDRFVVLARPTR